MSTDNYAYNSKYDTDWNIPQGVNKLYKNKQPIWSINQKLMHRMWFLKENDIYN